MSGHFWNKEEKTVFKVRDIRNGTVRTVYATNGMYFLFFVDGCWCWDKFEFYVPAEEQDD